MVYSAFQMKLEYCTNGPELLK